MLNGLLKQINAFLFKGKNIININELVLHVGLHKTGSTSIQESLFSEENLLLLNSKDYLYPRSLENNHTIPLYSAFCDIPEEFIVNMRNGYSSDEIKQLNEKNLNNLRFEIANCKQKKLIISGEGISLLSTKNLISLKKFLNSMYLFPPKIRVIIYVRNPISWAVSMVQEKLKHGLDYKTSLDKAEEDLESLYRTRIGKFVDVFGQKNVDIYSFENAIKHEFSITGHFLSILGFSCDEISKFKMHTTNVSMSQLPADILSYINFKLPLIKDGKLNPQRSSTDFIPILEIRGPKFNINYSDKVRLLEKCQNDIKWLKDNYKIDYSNTIFKENEIINMYLDNEAIETLINVHRNLSPVLKNLFKEYFKIQLESSSYINTTIQLKYLLDKLN